MPIVIELTHEQDVAVLTGYLEAVLRQHRKAPISHSMPKIEQHAFERCLEALKHAKGSGIPKSVAPPPLVLDEERPQRTVKAQSLVLCGQHPQYTAQRKPRTGCAGCWAAYKRAKNHGASTQETT